jgi:hypothetical protein
MDAVLHFVALAVGDNQEDLVAVDGEAAALLDEYPGIVTAMRRSQVCDPEATTLRIHHLKGLLARPNCVFPEGPDD